jgi:hypothetical protein
LAVGDIISELAAQGIEAWAGAPIKRKAGFPVFDVPRGARPIGLDDVKRDEDGDAAV